MLEVSLLMKNLFLIVFDYGLSQSIPIHTLLPMLEIKCSNNGAAPKL